MKKIKKIFKKNKFINIFLNNKIFKIKKKKIKKILMILYKKMISGSICLPIKKIIKHKKIFKYYQQCKKKKLKILKNELLKNKYISKTKNTPIILRNKSLYINKFYYLEKKIIKFFLKKRKDIKIKRNKKNILKKFLCKNVYDINQKISIILSILKKIIFIIGKPGTGKTTIISKIIFIIKKIFSIKKIILTAPTGKATNRLLNNTKKNLLKLNTKHKYNIKSYTLHKLLKINSITQKPYLNKKNKINANLLIIDETSMIDLSMIKNLISALPKKCKIIFLGDDNQLPSINQGSFLKDISKNANNNFEKKTKNNIENILNIKYKNNKNKKKNIINNNIIFLKKNYRFKKNLDIIKFSKKIKNFWKKKKNKNSFFLKKKFKNIKFYYHKKKNSYFKMIQKISKKYQKYWKLIQKKSKPKNIIKEFQKNRILCILKNTKLGSKIINKNLEKYMIYKKKYFIKNNYIKKKKKKKKWYIGKPIMITKNDNFLNLYNGDIGIVLREKKGKLKKNKKVFFYEEITKKIKKIPINLIKNYELSWSSTVHKSQGLEFNSIQIIIPQKINNLFSKEILYTAITRSKKNIEIYCEKKIFLKILKKTNIRYSNINKKLLIYKNKK